MAVETTNALSGPFLPNGATLTFPFTFTAPSPAEVAVMLRAPDGTETAATGFSVALTPGGGGSVTFAVAPAAGPELFILLDPFFTQQIEFENGSGWLAEPVNEVADRGASRDQVLKRDISRALLAPLGESALVMPSAAGRAGKYLSFDALGRPVAASGTGNDANLRTDLAAVGGDTLLRFDPAGDGALPSTVGDTLRLVGVFVHHFGAVGDGTTDDAAAFNAATVVAQALGVPLVVPAGEYRVGGWVVGRAGGGIEIRCSPHATMKLPDDAGSALSVLDIKADGVRLLGGRFDGNVDELGAGENSCVRAFSEVSGEQISDVILSPDFVGNCSAQGIFVVGAARTIARGVYSENTGLNGIAFVTGNTAFSGYDTDVSDCTIEDCVVDRSAMPESAQQGCIKFYENGDSATAKEVINCRIVNCVGKMPETDGLYNGNVAIEVWAKGRGNLIEGCVSEGGHIGISVSQQNFAAIISNCHARRAELIGIEMAAGNGHKAIGCTVDCDDFTKTGVSLDYQSISATPGYGMSCVGMTVLKPTVRGVVVIADAPTTANVWKGTDVTVQAHIQFGSTANVKGVELLNIEGFDVEAFIDGNDASGANGVVMDRCTSGSVRVSSKRIASQIFQIIRNGDETTDNIHLELKNLDGTGTSFQLAGSSGAFGSNLSLDIWGAGYYSVVNARLTKIAELYADCCISSGRVSGDPNGSIDAARGSILQSDDGNIYTRSAASPSDAWAVVTVS